MPELASPNESNPVSDVCVSEEEAKNMKVGETVNVTVSGKVKSIHEEYNHNGKYRVSIEAPSNAYDDKEMSKEEMNSPDVEEKIKDMSAEKLRKKLPKAERDY